MSALYLIAGALSWSLLVAHIAFRLGKRVGFRMWKTDADRAFMLGMNQGRRDERAETGRGL